MLNGPRLAAALGAAALVLPAAAADAKAPPTGKYDCTIGANNILFGTLTIKGGHRYAHRGSKGTFAGKGSKLTFKGGDLNKMKGRWSETTDGVYEIALRNPRDNFESIYCDRRS